MHQDLIEPTTLNNDNALSNHETSIEPMTLAEEQPWRGFLRFHASVTRQMSADLQGKADLTLAEFELIGHLHEQHDRSMVMNELADLIQITPSGVTRMVDRLVLRGYIERRAHPGDARRQLAQLTDTGIAIFESTVSFHHEGVRNRFLNLLSPEERRTFASVWARLLD